MSKTNKILTVFLVFAFLCASVTPAFAWWGSSNSRSSDYYESQSYRLDDFKTTPKYQPQTQPSLWQRVSTNVGNLVRNVGNFCSSAFNGIKNVFTNVVDFTKSIFTKVGNFFTGTKDDAQVDSAIKKTDSTLDKTSDIEPETEGQGLKTTDLSEDKMTTEEYFDNMESGQSIFEPTEPEQVSGRDVKEVIQEIRDGDKELGYAGVPDSPSEIQKPPHEIAIDDKSKITDIEPQQIKDYRPKTIGQNVEKQLVDVTPVTPLKPIEADPGVMPGESWEKVKKQIDTSQPEKESREVIVIQGKEIDANIYRLLSDEDKAILNQPSLYDKARQAQEDAWNGQFLPKNQDAVKFYDILSPNEQITTQKSLDRVSTDFSSHKDFESDFMRHIEGAADVAKRGAKVAISMGVAKAAGKAAQAEQLNKAAQKTIEKFSGSATSVALAETEIKLLDNDRLVFKEIPDKISSELSRASVRGISYTRNVITAKEAERRNNQKTTISLGAAIANPVAGAVVGMVKTQRFEAGQEEYKLQVEYYDDRRTLYKERRIDLYYRKGDYKTSDNKQENGVIEMRYVPSFYDASYLRYVPDCREVEYAPK